MPRNTSVRSTAAELELPKHRWLHKGEGAVGPLPFLVGAETLNYRNLS